MLPFEWPSRERAAATMRSPPPAGAPRRPLTQHQVNMVAAAATTTSATVSPTGQR